MAEPLLTGELFLDEEGCFLTINLRLQKALLLLVEHCHQPNYQATLDCSLKALDDDLSQRQANNKQAFAPVTASMKKIMTMVLSACFDLSRERTLAKMREGFAVMDAHLSSERGDRERFEQALAKVSAAPPDEQDQL